MIAIRGTEGYGAEVSGGAAALAEVAFGIAALARQGGGSWTVAARGDAGAGPYAAAAHALVVAVGEGPARVRWRGDGVLEACGDPESLAVLASFFEVPPDASEGWHTHHEAYEGHAWIASDSLPLVVALREERPAHMGKPS